MIGKVLNLQKRKLATYDSQRENRARIYFNYHQGDKFLIIIDKVSISTKNSRKDWMSVRNMENV